MQGDRRTRWPITSREVLATGAVSSFVEDVVKTPSGTEMRRQFITHPGAVAIVPWDEETDRIAVVRQYRHPIGMELVEIPAGLLDVENEAYRAAAERELAEEVELQAGRWDVLVDTVTTPGACEESLRHLPGSRSPAGLSPRGLRARRRGSRDDLGVRATCRTRRGDLRGGMPESLPRRGPARAGDRAALRTPGAAAS